ncbi:UDP-glucose 6-dehydrogenase [Roseibaca ekhonensis]|jgi:UDPglucose 6-dehydrogenase|uniref:UDP-glucose 6-dehydrogenase n=1 Tax=Roseinatronobacter ekhonensis TaxID=254356 RepID=A0A3B0MRH7_9RHOB|nr:UDP-glucose 6-dehydrogenase [Roseibaca ekhonensis]
MKAHAFSARVPHAHYKFKAGVDLIVSDRLTDEISDVEDKVFARDLFGAD